jgi:hypothetical protein
MSCTCPKKVQCFCCFCGVDLGLGVRKNRCHSGHCRWEQRKESLPASRGCALCGKQFSPRRKDHIYCSRKCNKAVSRPRCAEHVRAWHYKRYHTDERVREAKLQDGRDRAHRLKLEVFDAYGGRACIGCGETEIVCLSLDHVAGGGNKHRIACKGRVYLDLKHRGFPPGYRVLCMSCQFRARAGVPLPNERIRKQMKPTIGRTVIFHRSPYEEDTDGNGIACSPDLPAVIVRVWSDDCVNLKVLSDGRKDIWVTSVHQGTDVHQWSWPDRTT